MDRPSLLELIGYAASILVAVSLIMSSVLRLRLINLVGSTGCAATDTRPLLPSPSLITGQPAVERRARCR